MKKILLFILLFISYTTVSYAYIDYRHDIKTDYYSSEIFMNNNLNEKYKIDKKIELIFKKIKKYNFDDKIDYIEKIKEKILSYLFSNHIQKNNVIYYRLVYYYNQVDNLKYKTDYIYKTSNLVNKYNTNNYYRNTYNCSFYYNGRKYYLSNNRIKYFNYNNYRIKYYCKNGIIYKDTYTYKYNNSYYSSYNNNEVCNLDIFGQNYTFFSGNYRTVFKQYSDKIEYRKYKCDNGDLRLISVWYRDIYNNY